MTRLALVDIGDTKLTDETLDIVSSVLEEYGVDSETVDYLHLPGGYFTPGVLRPYDLVVAFGSEAVKTLCKTTISVDKYAGSLTWNEDFSAWVLPTLHPNCIYMRDKDNHPVGYGKFDIVYDHLRRSCDLLMGRLQLPEVGGTRVDWEFVGHNGEPGWGGDPKVWSGYFQATEEETARQWYVLDLWLDELDNLPYDGTKLFGLDTESYDTNHFNPLTMIQVYDGTKSYAFTWGVVEAHKSLWQRFLGHRKARFALTNTKHDRKMIWHWLHISLDERDYDTMCEAMGLTEKGNQTGLKYNSRQYCNAPFYEEALDEWLDKDKINYGHIRPDVLAEYGCNDVYYSYQLENILPALVEREGTTSLVRNILLPAQRTFSLAEYDGILVDQDYADQLSEEWTPLIEAAIAKVQKYAAFVGFPADPSYTKNQVTRHICSCVPGELRSELDSIRCTSWGKYLRETHSHNPECGDCNRKRYVRVVDNTLNVRSSAQMQHLCFDILDMPQTWEGRKTNKNFWEFNQTHEFAQLVLAYRELDYLNRNIVSGFRRFIWEDGRVHPDFLLFGTKTGRLAVHNPAMQTIPARSDSGKRVKKLILPDPGHVLVNVDYSNLELYMAHHLTGDEALLEALQKDMHLMTAAAMYKKTCEEITAEERQSAKPVNFGSGYNIKAKKLARDKNLIGITEGKESIAQEFLDAFWGKYSTWYQYKEDWKKEAVENCELRTELGRVRRWSLITQDNLWKVENQATNFKGQSLASDLCLTSWIKLDFLLRRRGYGRVLFSVHDSLVFSIYPGFFHQAVELIREVMTTPVFETNTPFRVDVTYGPNYGDQYPYDPEVTFDDLQDMLGVG